MNGRLRRIAAVTSGLLLLAGIGLAGGSGPQRCPDDAAETVAPGQQVGTGIWSGRPGRRGSGLRGEYFAGTMSLDHEDGGEPVMVRTDPRIDFDWGEGAPDRKVGANIFSVRWTGYVVPPATGEYTFHLTSDDGSRLWIDDELLIDNWSDHLMREKAGRISLAAGVARRVKVEFYENMVYTGVRLEWTPPKRKREVVPSGYLYGPETDFAPPVVATVAAGGGTRHRAGSKVKIIVSEKRGEEGLTGRLRITSESVGYECEVPGCHSLPDGVYLAEWDTAGLAPAEDYAVEVTLTDAAGNSDADGLPETPDLLIALEPGGRMLSLGDPQGGPPRPACAAERGAAGKAEAPGAVVQLLLVLLLLGCCRVAGRTSAACR